MNLIDFIGKGDSDTFFGIVEDNADPITLGRVRVRCFGIHPEDRQKVPTIDLPWAIVLQPATSASVSGIGWSPNGLEQGSVVFGIFLDGKTAQYPLVLGTIATVHRPNAPGDPGSSYAGFLNDSPIDSGEAGGNAYPYHGNNPESAVNKYNPSNPNNTGGPRASIKDDGSYLTKADIPKWPLQIYKWTPSNNNTGLACKDADSSLWIHYATALALENLTRDVGVSSFKITSAYRSRAYNDNLRRRGIRAAKNSQHIYGRAFDIAKSSIPDQDQFLQLAVKNGFVGFGIYSSFIHIDTGTGRVWNGANSSRIVNLLKSAGWYSGKPGLTGIKTVAGVSNTEVASTSTINELFSSDSLKKGGAESTNNTAGDNLRNLSHPNAIYIRDRLSQEGYTTEGIAAVLGAVLNESNFNPNATAIDTNNKRSSGICQWNGERDSRMRTHTESNGYSWNSIEGQVEYFIYEQKKYYPAIYNTLTGSTSLYSCFEAMNKFEAYAGYNNTGSREYQERWNDTKAFYNGDPGPGDYMAGFNDPTNSLPFRDYRGQPSTHFAARGFNSTTMNRMESYEDGLSNMPIAGDKGTFGSPDNPYAAQYPYNKTYSSRSGHLLEFDDTPNAERINIRHKSGSKFTFTAKGTVIEDVKGKRYVVVDNDEYHGILGNLYLTSRDDMNIRTTSDMTQHADGSWQMIIGNDVTNSVAGKYDLNVGEVAQIKAQKIIIEVDEIDIYSKNNINMQAEEAFNIKAKSFNVQTEEDVSVKTGKAINVQADKDISINSATNTRLKAGSSFFVESTEKTHIKVDDEMRIKVKEKIDIKSDNKIVQIDTASPSQFNQPPIIAGSAEEPSPADPADAKTVEDAESTDLGKAAARTKIEKRAETKEDPDSHNTAEDSVEQYSKRSI